MYSVAGKTILVTGGSRGMGKLFCQRGIAEGATVIIWARDQVAMDEVAHALSPDEQRIFTYQVDLSDRAAIEEAAKELLAEHGSVDILFNNAGVVTSGYFWEHSNDQIEQTMRINAEAPMYICRAFLPGMIASGEGRIVNMGSAAGLISNPNMSVYCASKWSLNGWSDSLRLELEQQGYDTIRVTTVTPGYVDTGMFAGARAPLLTPILKPETVVDKVWNAMKQGRIQLRTPLIIYLVPAFKGLLPPRLFDLIIGKIFGVYHSMDNFKGHR